MWKEQPISIFGPKAVEFLLECGADRNEQSLVDYGCLGPPHLSCSPWQRFLISLYSTDHIYLQRETWRTHNSLSDEPSMISKCIETFNLLLKHNAYANETFSVTYPWGKHSQVPSLYRHPGISREIAKTELPQARIDSFPFHTQSKEESVKLVDV